MKPKIQKTTHNESKSSSAETVVSVDDLLIEIFLLLPMKSLIRFKSVTKRWQSLISNPGFSILRNPNPNPATGLIFQGNCRPESPQTDPLWASKQVDPFIISFNDPSPQNLRTLKLMHPWPCYNTTTITSSCNGLLLCKSFNLPEASNPMEHRCYVFNPTTNKHLTLPQTHYDKVIQVSMCLAFDPSKSPHCKVVCALRLLDESEDIRIRHQFLVYSSETGCWRKSCVEPFQAADSVDFQRGVFWNGAMHWVSFKKNEKSIYFDPENDRMSQEMMPTPPMTEYDRSCNISDYYFGESRGHLHYTDGRCTWMVMEVVVYELRRDYSEWFVKYRIHHDPVNIGHTPYLCDVVRGKSDDDDDDDDDSFSVLRTEGKIVRYNFLNKTCETICGPDQGAPRVHVCLPQQHVESLCSV